MLLERDEQLRVLTGVLDRTGSDGGKIVLIRGEAGIGKSALISEFLTDQAARAHALVGYCDDLSTPHPLGPFWDLANQSPAVARPLEAGDRHGVLRATLELLSRELRPTVIVIEDSQWADNATIDAIRYLGRRIAGTNGVLVLTFRDAQVCETHPLRQVIGELDPGVVVRIRLNSLSQASIAALIGDSGAGLDPDEVYTMTDGNPLFATELVASAKVGLPVSVRDSVLARASKLSPKARDILDLVSVVPGESEKAMVLRLTGVDRDALSECEAHGLLEVGTDVVFFRHELTRHAIESVLFQDDRRQLNEAVLGELSVDGDLARIVHHAREAENVDVLLEFGPKAARAAAAIGGYQEAAANYRVVEPYLSQVAIDDRAAIYSDWAQVEHHVNVDAAEVLEILSKAVELHRQTENDLALAADLVMAAEANDELGHPEAVDACIGEALGILESHSPGAELAAALGRQAFVALRRGQTERTVELADRSLSLAEELGVASAAFSALNAKGVATYVDGDARGLDLLEEARCRAVQTGDVVEEIRAMSNTGAAHLWRREFEPAIEAFESGIAASIQANLAFEERFAEGDMVKALLLAGHWDRAEDIAVMEMSRPPSKLTTPHAKHVLARLAIRKGRPNAAALVDEAWADAEESDRSIDFYHLAAARAEHLWVTDKLNTEMAASLRQVEEEIAHESWEGEVSFWLWMVGDRSESSSEVPEPFGLAMRGAPEEAAKQWKELGMPFERAVSLVLCDGPQQLEGLELLETLGAGATAGRCRQMLRSRGVHVPRGRGKSTREHPVGLTARQDEVLELLAEDLTDGEIADRLFISTRTVNHHVSAVLGKLGVSSRHEAADRAHTLGLLTQGDATLA